MEPILYIGAAQSVFASIIILTKKPLLTADKILSGWLIVMTLWFITGITRLVFPEFSADKGIGGGLALLTYGPLLFLYSKYLIKNIQQFSYKELLHFLPFIIVLISYFVLGEPSRTYPISRPIAEDINTILFRSILGLGFLFTVVFYAFQTIRLNRIHKKNLEDSYANHNEKITLSWLMTIFYAFSITFGLVITLVLTNIFFEATIKIGYVVYSGIVAMVYIISFFGYRQNALIHSEPKALKSNEENKQSGRYEKSGLKEDKSKEYLQTLFNYMEEHKPWKKNDLTIQDLSERTEIPKHHITQIVNESLNKNFYTFVNEYRIKEVQAIFANSKYDHWSILAIAEESGFNSKSAFNNFFKLYTGNTPSQYRNSLKK